MRLFRWIGDLAFTKEHCTVKRARRSPFQWRARWYLFWWKVGDFIFQKVWRRLIRPHLFPQTCAREHREAWKNQALPHDINAFVWRADGVWLGQLYERNGPWSLCCFQANTEKEIKSEISEVLSWWEEMAGTRYPYSGYTIHWKEREPTAADTSYTR